MRILITNDDGIAAPGLEVLARIAAEVAGEGGEVWTVAPAFEQSGVGHCISYTHPTLVSEFGPRRWAAEGSPADCVLAAIHDVMPARPDLVLSGVNRGNNAGQNALYSGTIGGAMEAALQDVRAVALSQFLGPGTRNLSDMFEAAAAWGARTVRAILAADRWGGPGYGTFYNVNFPPCGAAGVRGLRAAAQGFRPTTRFGAEAQLSPGGKRFLWVAGGPQDERTEEGSDVSACLDGWIAVTPMRCDLTDRPALEALALPEAGA